MRQSCETAISSAHGHLKGSTPFDGHDGRAVSTPPVPSLIPGYNMKSPLRALTLFAAVVALIAVTGCKTVSTSSTQYLGGPVYAPTDPAQVQILRAPPN